MKENISFSPYQGRVRGARGVLFSRSGNALDTSLLIASVLDELDTPWRLAHATLDDEQAAQLINSVVPTASLSGVESDATPFEPGSTGWRRRLVADHWWIEARVEGDWMPLDTIYPGLDFGQAAVEPSERFGTREIPETLQHTVSMRVVYKRGMAAPQEVLSYSADLVDLSYRNLVLAFEPSGRRIIRPHLQTGSERVDGESFDRTQATEIWLELEFGYGDSAYRVQRELRTYPSSIQVYSLLFLPGWVGPDYYTAVTGALMDQAATGIGGILELIRTREDTSSDLNETMIAQVVEVLSAMTGLVGLSFANASDDMTLGLARQSGVRAYVRSPRILIAGAMFNADGLGFELDLRDDQVESLPFAGLPERLTTAFHVLRGRVDSALPDDVLRSFTGLPVLSAVGLLDEAWDQRLGITSVAATNVRTSLRRLSHPDDVTDRIESDATGGGGLVLVSRSPVETSEGPRSAWWQVRAATGQIIGVLDNGVRGAVSGFLASAPNDSRSRSINALFTADELMDATETLFASASDQMRYGRHLRDQACPMGCDIQRLADASCGDAAAASVRSCLHGAQAGDDLLGLGLSCADMIDAFRCGSWIGNALMSGQIQVDVDESLVFWGPWSRARAPLDAGRRCRCP